MLHTLSEKQIACLISSLNGPTEVRDWLDIKRVRRLHNRGFVKITHASNTHAVYEATEEGRALCELSC